MRFLCLHGMGTNSQIMESQIAALRHELDHVHTYDFVEGTVPSPLAAELKPFFPGNESYFNYFSLGSTESMLQTLADFSAFVDLEGPYDGVIAFSQGGCLAATYLIQQAKRYPQKPLPFECAIFLSGAIPFDPIGLERGEVRPLSPEVDGDQLLAGLPTAHIWGRNDDLWPGTSEVLYALCDPGESKKFLHDEGHAIPAARAKDALLGSARVIRRTVDRAAMAL